MNFFFFAMERVTIISEIPYGMTVFRNRVIGILNERMSNDIELQQSFQFFFNCFGHEDMIQKLWPAHWKLFEIKMKPFYQSLGKKLLNRRETLASQDGSLIDGSILARPIEEGSSEVDDPFAHMKKQKSKKNVKKKDKNRSTSKTKSFFKGKLKNKDKDKDKNKDKDKDKHKERGRQHQKGAKTLEPQRAACMCKMFVMSNHF